jgi:hypothetical protein
MDRKVTQFIGLALLASCASANGLDGSNAIVRVVDEPPGSACEFGGVKIESGLDENRDGNLAHSEVKETQFVCESGGSGTSQFAQTGEEPPGDNCASGGVWIATGVDEDSDQTLQESEIERLDYVCNGADGTAGEDGQDGTPGSDGVAGIDGANGNLTSLTSVSPGGACGVAGGVMVNVGGDLDGDGILDGGEITQSELLCDGADGSDGSDGTDGTDGAPGADGQDGAGTEALVVTAYQEMSVISNEGVDETILSVTITAPSAGTAVVFGSTHVFCWSSFAPQCDGGSTTSAYTRIVDAAGATPVGGDGHSYVFLADEVTSNVALSRTFTVPGAGSFTYYLRGEASVGDVGYYRTGLQAVFIGN